MYFITTKVMRNALLLYCVIPISGHTYTVHTHTSTVTHTLTRTHTQSRAHIYTCTYYTYTYTNTYSATSQRLPINFGNFILLLIIIAPYM